MLLCHVTPPERDWIWIWASVTLEILKIRRAHIRAITSDTRPRSIFDISHLIFEEWNPYSLWRTIKNLFIYYLKYALFFLILLSFLYFFLLVSVSTFLVVERQCPTEKAFIFRISSTLYPRHSEERDQPVLPSQHRRVQLPEPAQPGGSPALLPRIRFYLQVGWWNRQFVVDCGRLVCMFWKI